MALPTEDAVRVAVRTQQILAEESGVANVADPLGGAYFVEALTNRLEEEAVEYLRKIDQLGGALKAVDTGYIQREVAKAAYEFQRRVESKDYVVVGVNDYVLDDEPLNLKLLEIDESYRYYQIDRINRLKERRDKARFEAALDRMREDAARDRNMMESTMEAVKAYATLQELWDVYRERWGVFDERTHLCGLEA
jgi:methylmalonyl-CoA mutase N-terminal domain/subunit